MKLDLNSESAILKRPEMAYLDTMRDWARENATLVAYWQKDDVADVGIFDNHDGTYTVLRAFPLNGKVQISVDEDDYRPKDIGQLVADHFKHALGQRTDGA